jgi:hypothetical protein
MNTRYLAEGLCRWLVSQPYADLAALQTESELHTKLRQVPSPFDLEPCHHPPIEGLFGQPDQTDFHPRSDPNIVVEAKLVRADRSGWTNEYDARNGLGQTLAQAFFAKAHGAVLLIVDAGRVSNRPLSAPEQDFIQMFISNPYVIRFAVCRVRLDAARQAVFCEVIS